MKISCPAEIADCLLYSFMKQILFIFLCQVSCACLAQTYISLAPSISNNAGTLGEKANFAFEVGRQWDVFSLGIDYGRINLAKVQGKDTTNYIELRPNLNIFQQGRFTNTFTAGIGYIFNSQQSLLTELTSGIEYTCNDQFHINVYFGQYYYSGRLAASTETFFGISAVWYFAPSNAKSLITQPAKK
jgi:hypothetical protein